MFLEFAPNPGRLRRVSFFTHILKIPRSLLVRLREERTQTRYRVGPDFPLMATVSLPGINRATREARGDNGRDWDGRVRDVSAYGLSLHLPAKAAVTRNENATVRFVVEGRKLDIPCTVAHCRALPAYVHCGLRLEFPGFPQQRAWLQIVEAVGFGACFAPVAGRRAPRPALGLTRRQWRSLRQARLTEWRETGTRQLDRFELVLEDYRFEGRNGESGLSIRSDASGRAAMPDVEVELHQLFLWVLANFPASVPADLKAFMRLTAITLASPSEHRTRGPF